MAALGWSVASQYNATHSTYILNQKMSVVMPALQAEIARYSAISEVLREDPRILAAIDDPKDQNLSELYSYLSLVSDRTGAKLLVVLDDKGNVIASSTADVSGKPALENLAFRPYFRNTIQNGSGLTYAIGYPSGTPGLYISSRVELVSGKTGVVVAKIGLSNIERTWRNVDAPIALVDQNGVVFLTNRSSWRYRPVLPLSDDTLAAIAQSHQYEGIDMAARAPLWTSDTKIKDNVTFVANEAFLFREQPLERGGWRIIVAHRYDGSNSWASAFALMIALLGLIVWGSVYIYHQRGLLIRLKNEQSVLLEQRVEERTRELAVEVETRHRTEESLRHAEQDLVQAAKLAALGQMSAALAHEVSQPIIALAAILTAAERRLDAAETESARQLIERAQSLTHRIQHIIRHLRSFSKKEHGEGERMDIAASIQAALELAETRAHEIGVSINTVGLDQQVEVFGNPIRFEQVLINLLLNALDAVTGCERREVGIRLSMGTQVARIEVWDTGPGIPDGFSSKLSEPFFTTKTGEDGVGLGLSISRSILNDFGASMRFMPRKGGGTVCEVRFPLAVGKEKIEAAE